MFQGSITALVTPFRKGEVDEKALRKMVDFQVKSGTDALVPTGTTGESPTLTHEEHRRVIEIVIEQAAGRVPVIAGTGSNSTQEAISLTKHAASMGAAGALLIAPYYNRPNARGIYEHFKRVGSAAGIPLVLYNHQGRTGVTIAPETVKALSEVIHVAAVKDASGGIVYTSDVLEQTGGRVAVLSGNDAWTLALMAVGASGVISVVANLAPKDMAELVHAYQRGETAKAKKMHYKLMPLIRGVELDVNPIPVKAAMALLGTIDGEIRLPLVALDKKKSAKLQAALKAYKLLK